MLVRCLEILDHLHTRTPPIVHRDLKPSNIVRAPDGKIALVDFGGVLDAAREKGGSTIVGTFGYMAPEQLHGQVMPATVLYRSAPRSWRSPAVELEDRPAQGPPHGPRSPPPRARRQPPPRARDDLTDPVEKRPQRARDVVALLAKSPPPAEVDPPAERPRPLALERTRSGPPARRIFSDVGEPLGTLLRFGVLGFGAGGWLGMASLRLSLAPHHLDRRRSSIFPARHTSKNVRGVGRRARRDARRGPGRLHRHDAARDGPPLTPVRCYNRAMVTRLITILFSHFCEKARWALDRVGILTTRTAIRCSTTCPPAAPAAAAPS